MLLLHPQNALAKYKYKCFFTKNPPQSKSIANFRTLAPYYFYPDIRRNLRSKIFYGFCPSESSISPPYQVQSHLSICNTCSKHLYTSLYILLLSPYFCKCWQKCHFQCWLYREKPQTAINYQQFLSINSFQTKLLKKYFLELFSNSC